MTELRPKPYGAVPIMLFSWLAGPFVGLYLVSRNYRLFGDHVAARRTLLIGMPLAVLVIVGLAYIYYTFTISYSSPLRLGLSWIPATLIWFYAYPKQEMRVRAYLKAGPTKAYNIKQLIGISLVLIALAWVIAFAALISLSYLDKDTRKAQEIARQQAVVDDNLRVYINKPRQYSIKLPKDFVLTRSEGAVDYFESNHKSGTPFRITVFQLPVLKELVYVDDATANSTINDTLIEQDSYFIDQGFSDVITVSGDIAVPGTNYKRAYFTKAELVDEFGRHQFLRIETIPKNDGSGVLITAAMPRDQQANYEYEIDTIFASINLNPR